MKTFDVVIIGAGSIGLPAAFYLSQKKLKTAVIDKFASEGRGQNRAAIGGIRATFSDPAKIKICQYSIEVIKRMNEEHGKDVDWIQGGYLYPAYNEEIENSLKNLLVKQKQFNLNIDWISAEQVKEIVPGINSNNLLGGIFSPEDGSASPLKVAGAYYSLSRKIGVEFFFNQNVIDTIVNKDKSFTIKTDKEEFNAKYIINASGADAYTIGKMVELDLPVIPDSHEAGITEPVNPIFKPMIVDIRADAESTNYYFYQNKEGQFVFCITPKPPIVGTDCENTSVFLPLVVRRMLELYPRLRNIRVRRTWRGLYPMTPDGFPIVGFTRDVENYFLAVGMCGQGFMIGPGLGVIISEIISDNSNEYDFILNQLSLYRNFAGNEILK